MYRFSEKVFHIETFLHQLKAKPPKRIVLFGAGGYGEALLDELIKRDISQRIFFMDNDRTKQGLKLKDRPILSPQSANPSTDIVVITTISAGDQVSRQLERMGFRGDVNYFEVMQNLNSDYPFYVIDFYKCYVSAFSGLDVLHVGPGGHMGVELLLCMMGAQSVFSLEYHSYNLAYPEITRAEGYYRDMEKVAISKGMGKIFENGLIKEENKRMLIDQNIIHLLYPCSVTALPFKDKTFDLILHHAVFEHVPNPERGYREIFRTLKPDGITVGLVDPQDHRIFSSFQDYYPLKFLEYSRSEWYEIAKKINFHNQVTTPEHKDMILSQGFEINKWDNLMEMDISDEIWQSFNPRFRNFDRKEIGVLRFAFSACKPADK